MYPSPLFLTDLYAYKPVSFKL